MDDLNSKTAEQLDNLMTLRELLTKARENSDIIRATGRINYVPPTLWDIIEANDDMLRSLCDVLIQLVPDMAKLATNEALMAHTEAVMSAD